MRFSLPLLLLLTACSQAIEKPSAASEPPLVEEAVDRSVSSATIDEGAELVQAHCGACHSLALVAQNRMTRRGWINTIRWMQEKQGLWDLGDSQAVIVEYLAQTYGVTEVPWRRKPLE